MAINVLFKQTTSEKIKCRKCRRSVEGKDGYIKINLNFYMIMGWSRRAWKEKKIAVCMGCFRKWSNGIIDGEKNKEETYNKLVKTKILKGLN